MEITKTTQFSHRRTGMRSHGWGKASSEVLQEPGGASGAGTWDVWSPGLCLHVCAPLGVEAMSLPASRRPPPATHMLTPLQNPHRKDRRSPKEKAKGPSPDHGLRREPLTQASVNVSPGLIKVSHFAVLVLSLSVSDVHRFLCVRSHTQTSVHPYPDTQACM